MKPLKDYVEIIFAVLALAGLVFVFWYFLVAVPAKKAEQSGTFVMVPGTEMEVCRGTVTGVLKTIGDMDDLLKASPGEGSL